MNKTTRKRYGPKFKMRVALDVVRDNKTLSPGGERERRGAVARGRVARPAPG
jgi:hypothetical protein